MAAATPTAAAATAAAAAGGSSGQDEFELPKSVIQRLFKAKVPDNAILSKEGRAALAEATTVFISYLAATANDLATAKGAKTLSAAAVYQALEDLGFEDFCAPVRSTVDAFKQTSQERRQASTEKRKAKEAGLAVDPDNAGDMEADRGAAAKARKGTDEEDDADNDDDDAMDADAAGNDAGAVAADGIDLNALNNDGDAAADDDDDDDDD